MKMYFTELQNFTNTLVNFMLMVTIKVAGMLDEILSIEIL